MAAAAPDVLPPVPERITANERAFTVLVRNAMFRRVELAALRRWEQLGELEAENGSSIGAEDWREALEEYFAEHDSIDIGSGRARAADAAGGEERPDLGGPADRR